MKDFDKLLKLIDTIIPKPQSKEDFKIKGEGIRRKEKALIYKIPSHSKKQSYYGKGITETEYKISYQQLLDVGEFTREWFNKNLPNCAKEGSCNFTTIGGLFILQNYATYSERGIYKKV